MRTHRWRIRLWTAGGMLLVHSAMLSGASSQPLSAAGNKEVSSTITSRSGIDVSELTDVNAMGFLSPERVAPWGRLVADETERMLLAEKDTVYVALEKGHQAKPGDILTVYNSALKVDHPLTGMGAGYLISYLGRIVLKSEERPRFFKAEIVKAYRPIQVGDPIFPFQALSPCVRLSDNEAEAADPSRDLELPVVAAKDRAQVIGQYSVVYLDRGQEGGVHRGNLLQIVARGENQGPLGSPLPDRSLGYVLIIEARPGTSTGLVITAKREFSVGTLLRPVALKRTLTRLLTYYGMEQDPVGIEKNPLQVVSRLREKAGSAGPELPEAFLLLLRLPRCAIQ